MKKKLLLVAIASLTALVGCGGTGTETETPATENTEKPTEVVTDKPTEAPVQKGTIRFAKSEYEVERSASITIRATVTIPGGSNMTVNYSVDNESIVTLPDNVNGVSSIKITGRKIGSCVITATSVEDPTLTASVTVKVVQFKSALRSVWNNVIKKKNYTLTSVVDGDDDPSSILKVTPEAITLTDNSGGSLVQLKSLDENEDVISFDAFGIALNADDYGYYILKDQAGEWFTPLATIQTNVGLLNASNFLGLGANASSWNDVDPFFFGLQAINPNWFTSTKEESNIYAIEGSKTDIDSAFAEAMLWQLVDPVGRREFLEGLGENSTVDTLAAEIETSITVVDNNTVSIQIEQPNTGASHIATLTDVGTTSIDADINSYISGDVNVPLPALNNSVALLKEAFAKNDYSVLQKLTYGDITEYYAPNYWFNGYTPEFIAAVEAAGKTATIGGICELNNALYEYTITPEVKDAEGNVTTRASCTLGNQLAQSTGVSIVEVEDFHYMSQTVTFGSEDNNLLYTLIPYSYNGGVVYLSSSKELSDELSYVYLGGATIKELIDSWGYYWESYLTQVKINSAKAEAGNAYVTSVDIGFGSFAKDASDGGYMLSATYDFTPCATKNPYDALIKAMIAKNTVA
ncbi:MAG: hypothetical protein SOT51_06015 [Candidatus Enterosoma sp.]|nr:hypothetical protein [Candidatus Enterosoma sp.]